MNKLRLMLAIAATVSAASAAAQVEWIEKDYDFGTWFEDEGLREGVSRFVNRGTDAVMIRRVRPSCGCTGVEWPEDPIAPGDTAAIRFSYNPEGRPGAFDKSIRVYLDNNGKPDVIRIKGTIIGKESSLRHRYPVICGPLRLTERVVDFGRIQFGDVRPYFINCYNTSPQPVTPVLSPITPGENTLPVEVEIVPATVQPGEIQSISIYLNSRHAPQMGSLEAVQTICLADTCIDIVMTGYIVPETGKASAGAPQANLSTNVIELSDLRRDKKCKIEFTIFNTGRSVLELKRVYSQMPQLTITKFPARLKAGKQGHVEGYINTAAITGGQVTGFIEVITNDPLQPVQRVRFAGVIRE